MFFIYLKKEPVSLNFSIVFMFSISLISALIFTIYVLLIWFTFTLLN